MLYLWANRWSRSLCSPNLFYILLWPLVLSGPSRQLLLERRKRQVQIDQDLHVYMRELARDLFGCFPVIPPTGVSVNGWKFPET
jgi:hypothetical protein